MKFNFIFFAALIAMYMLGLFLGLWLFGTRTPDPELIRLQAERDSLQLEAIQWQIDYAACAKARYENRTINELPLRK